MYVLEPSSQRALLNKHPALIRAPYLLEKLWKERGLQPEQRELSDHLMCKCCQHLLVIGLNHSPHDSRDPN